MLLTGATGRDRISLRWVARLDRYAPRVNPVLADVLTSMSYYWVTTQAEYATDLLFKSRQRSAQASVTHTWKRSFRSKKAVWRPKPIW